MTIIIDVMMIKAVEEKMEIGTNNSMEILTITTTTIGIIMVAMIKSKQGMGGLQKAIIVTTTESVAKVKPMK